MSLIDLDDRRRARQPRAAPAAGPSNEALVQRYKVEGADLATLAVPVVEEYRRYSPSLEQHLKGAFLRWHVEQIKLEHGDDSVAVGLAMTASVEAFTDRMIELQDGFDPNGGAAA